MGSCFSKKEECAYFIKSDSPNGAFVDANSPWFSSVVTALKGTTLIFPQKTSLSLSNSATWRALPSGATHIIESLVAERIYELEIHRNDDLLSKEEETRRTRALVSRFPSICHRKYHVRLADGHNLAQMYPLQLLLMNDFPMDLVEMVYKLNPEALTAPLECCSCRRTSLFDFACTYSSLETVQFICSHNPNVVSSLNGHDLYPLHLVCHFPNDQGRQEIIEFLLKEYPQAASKMCKIGHPLHYAVWQGASVSILEMLYQACPDSATARSSQGYTVLHLAMFSPKPQEKEDAQDQTIVIGQHDNENDNKCNTMAWLLERAPDVWGIEMPDTAMLPLEVAASISTPDVIDVLLRYAPYNVGVVHGEGRNGLENLPLLHRAVSQNTADSVDLLASRFPAMVCARYRGRTPLHWATVLDNPTTCGEDPLLVVKALLRHNRRALFLPSEPGGLLPRDMALRARPDSALANFLVDETSKGP